MPVKNGAGAIEECISKGIFQLNAMIACVTNDPIGGGGHLSALGFELAALSQSCPLDLKDCSVASDAGIAPSEQPCPDMIIVHKGRGTSWVIECKKSSFGIESGTSKQAYGLMIACGRGLAGSAGTPGDSACLTYLSSSSQADGFASMLAAVRSDVEAASLPIPPIGFSGLRSDGGTVTLDLKALPPELGVRLTEVKVCDVDASGRPGLFYHMPIDPDLEQDDYGDSVLWSRLLRFLISRVIRQAVPGVVEIDAEEALLDVTGGLYEKVGLISARKGLRKKVKRLIHDTSQRLGRDNEQPETFTRRGFVLKSVEDKDTVLKLLQGLDEQQIRTRSEFQPELF